uniref:uncharacterized protein LOC122582668 isoform X1 n=1 Tax=Erigeron canadensis TaxID=72917 RepID=UPI001CB8E8CC|nr:uncharacterized protein LOC122582668 isoform X1 [Erigeron canadensis]
MKEQEGWVAAAFSTDALVAHLLLRLKQSSSSQTILINTTTTPFGHTWGDRKSRSKAQQHQQQRSPTTPFSSWSGGSDGDGESCRNSPSDRSVKVGGSTTFIDTRKRKLDLHQNPVMENNIFIQTSCKGESKVETGKRRFVLPDLNESPASEELVAL